MPGQNILGGCNSGARIEAAIPFSDVTWQVTVEQFADYERHWCCSSTSYVINSREIRNISRPVHTWYRITYQEYLDNGSVLADDEFYAYQTGCCNEIKFAFGLGPTTNFEYERRMVTYRDGKAFNCANVTTTYGSWQQVSIAWKPIITVQPGTRLYDVSMEQSGVIDDAYFPSPVGLYGDLDTGLEVSELSGAFDMTVDDVQAPSGASCTPTDGELEWTWDGSLTGRLIL